MTAYVTSSRYSAEDFETASVRSAAPSYLSEAPSYHSNTQESIPAYTPRTTPTFTQHLPSNHSRTPSQPSQSSGGLPPVPARPPVGIPQLPNFRIPNWSANTAVAARQYRNVAERRVTDGRYNDDVAGKGPEKKLSDGPSSPEDEDSHPIMRPLEDPYLVGEVAAAKARRERLARETGDDILILEDKRWDWFLSQMKDWDERERSWKQFRREVDSGQRKRLMRRINGAR